MAPLTSSISASSLLDHIRYNLRRQTDTPPKNEIDSKDLSSSAKAGIAFGVIIPVILLGLLFFYLYIHNWQLPERLRPQNLRNQVSQKHFVISSPIQWRPKSWRPKSWHRVASVTTRTSPTESRTGVDDEPPKLDVEVSERPLPGKWWSAEEIAKGGDRNNTGRSRFSVVAPPWETHEPKVVKAPRPPSIFTSKTSIYGVERNGEPEVVRPGSKRVKTLSKHISAQFLDFGNLGRSPTLRSPREDGVREEEGQALQGTEVPEVPKLDKRNSKAVVTNLDWQEYEIPEVPRM